MATGRPCLKGQAHHANNRKLYTSTELYVQGNDYGTVDNYNRHEPYAQTKLYKFAERFFRYEHYRLKGFLHRPR